MLGSTSLARGKGLHTLSLGYEHHWREQEIDANLISGVAEGILLVGSKGTKRKIIILSHNQNPVLEWLTQNHVRKYQGGRLGNLCPWLAYAKKPWPALSYPKASGWPSSTRSRRPQDPANGLLFHEHWHLFLARQAGNETWNAPKPSHRWFPLRRPTPNAAFPHLLSTSKLFPKCKPSCLRILVRTDDTCLVYGPCSD